MAERLEIYKCEVCGNIVEVLHGGAGELVCCGQPMKLFKENTTDAAKEKHVPVVEKSGEEQSRRDRADEVVGGRDDRIRRAAAAQRVDPPRDAGPGHHRRAERRRSGETRRNQVDDPAQRGDQTGPLDRMGSLASHEPPRDHRRWCHQEDGHQSRPHHSNAG